MSIYCGNNALYPSLLSGGSKLGTRHECLKKGIGVGINLPVDDTYEKYKPIDKTKKYCGNKKLPVGYDRYATLLECLQTGVGIGKKIKYNKIRSSRSKRGKKYEKRSRKSSGRSRKSSGRSRKSSGRSRKRG